MNNMKSGWGPSNQNLNRYSYTSKPKIPHKQHIQYESEPNDLESKRKNSLEFFSTAFVALESSEIETTKEIMRDELRCISKKIGSRSIFFSWGQMGRNDVPYRWQWLSNMFPCQVEIDGIVYPSTEHYFQLFPLLINLDSPENQVAFKELLEIKDAILMRSQCKKRGKYGALMSSLEDKISASTQNSVDVMEKKAWKIQVLKKALQCKMEQYVLIQELLRWSREWHFDIVEIGSSFRTPEEPKDEDTFWNRRKWKGKWYGMNMTGKLWMEIRDESERKLA